MTIQLSPIASALCALVLALTVRSFGQDAQFTRVDVASASQIGQAPEGAAGADLVFLSNEPKGASAIALEFDLESVAFDSTPLARIQMPDVAKAPVKRPGEKPTTGKGALHAFAQRDGFDEPQLVGSTAVKPAGIPMPYMIDVTEAISEALARPKGQRRIHVELRITGQPAAYEVYGVPIGDAKKPYIEIAAPPPGWTNDWAERVAPITQGAQVYREACMPFAKSADDEAELKLLYPVKHVTEVIHNGTGEKLQEGRDWILRDGKVFLPGGTHAPVQIESAFFRRPPSTNPASTSSDGKSRPPLPYVLKEGTFYHLRQIEVTYEPAKRDWTFPPAVSSRDKLPRVRAKLAKKEPVTIILLGDSIEYGGNASRMQAANPFQPQFGELTVWALRQAYGGPITVMNHSRGGAGALFGSTQALSQAGWFKPDLVIVAYGMNDRSDKRRATYKQDMENIIDTIHQASPATEFIAIASMMNNPKQPVGSEPIFALRDLLLSIDRPDVAFVDMTTTHQTLLERKDYLDTSGNGANHPNDFLHRIYAMRLLELLLP
jgi:lysophospholipase L1-like esterase